MWIMTYYDFYETQVCTISFSSSIPYTAQQLHREKILHHQHLWYHLLRGPASTPPILPGRAPWPLPPAPSREKHQRRLSQETQLLSGCSGGEWVWSRREHRDTSCSGWPKAKAHSTDFLHQSKTIWCVWILNSNNLLLLLNEVIQLSPKLRAGSQAQTPKIASFRGSAPQMHACEWRERLREAWGQGCIA